MNWRGKGKGGGFESKERPDWDRRRAKWASDPSTNWGKGGVIEGFFSPNAVGACSVVRVFAIIVERRRRKKKRRSEAMEGGG